YKGTSTIHNYTLSLHDALPISRGKRVRSTRNISCSAAASEDVTMPIIDGHEGRGRLRDSSKSPSAAKRALSCSKRRNNAPSPNRSEEHTSELQSLAYLVCRLLL